MKRGTICLALPNVYIDMVVEEVLKDFCLEYSFLEVHIEEINAAPQITTQILEDMVHIGLLHGPIIHNPDIYVRNYTPLPIRLLVNPNHPLAKKARVHFPEIAPYPLALSIESFSTQQMIQSIAHSEKIQLIPALVSSSISAQKKFVIGTESACTFMSTLAAHQEIKTGQLVAIEIDHPELNAAQASLIVRRNRTLAPETRELAERFEKKLSIFSHKKEPQSVKTSTLSIVPCPTSHPKTSS